MITRNEAADRIALFASEGRLIQSQWRSERDGRELACILGAIGPDVNDPDDCPAEIMPAWLAHLLPTLFDGVRPERAREYGTRFADALKTGRTDDSVKRAFLIGTIEQALASATPAAPVPDYWPAVEAACRDTIAALRANDAAALTAAAEAARAAGAAAWAAWAAAEAADAGAAAWAAAEAAHAAARAAAETAARAAWAAAGAAASTAAWAADAADAAASTAAWAADAANERLFDTLLAAMTGARQ